HRSSRCGSRSDCPATSPSADDSRPVRPRQFALSGRVTLTCARGSGFDGGMTDRTKPEFDAPTGPAPTELVIRDITVGDGDEAKPGDTVTVHYAGVEHDSGEEFDSSWGRGETIQFPLRGLIQGWQE